VVAGASGHATTLRAPLELACQGDLLAVVFLVGLVCLGVAHHLAQVLVVHLSSLFLNLRRADFGARANLCVDLAFASLFLALRLVLLPLWWVRFLSHAYASDPAGWGPCMHRGVLAAAAVGGVIMHGLNAYWGLLIARKVARKLAGAGELRADDGMSSDAAEGHFKCRGTGSAADAPSKSKDS